MTTAPKHGDVLIRAYAGARYQLLDAATHTHIAIVGNLQMAVTIASERGGAVWRENVDNRGRPLGDAVLLLPKQSAVHTGHT